jgi:hypothetical protein
MRYRIRVTRVPVAERSVRAKDEEHAMDKVRTELDQPYGFLGQWQLPQRPRSSPSSLERTLRLPFLGRARC